MKQFDELPLDIQERMLEEQERQGNKRDKEVFRRNIDDGLHGFIMEKKELFDFIDSDRIEINLIGNDGFDEQEIKDGKEYLKQLINEMIDTLSMSKSMLVA